MSDELAAIRERDTLYAPIEEVRTLLALLDAEREARASAEASVAALREVIEAAVDFVDRVQEYARLNRAEPGRPGPMETKANIVGALLRSRQADTRAAAEAHNAAIRREAAREYRAELRAWVKSNAVSAAYTFGGALVVDHDALDTLLAEPSDA